MSNYQTEVFAYGMYDEEPTLLNGYVVISSRTIPIYYFDYNGQAIWEGDIVVSTTQQMVDFSTYITTECGGDLLKVDPAHPSCIWIQKPWSDGIIPYMYESNISKEIRDVIVAAINIVNSNEQLKSVVRFVQRVDEKDMVSFTRGAGYSSHIGKTGGKQLITVPGDAVSGHVLHELVHTIGLLHEQTRTNRNDFVQIAPAGIITGLENIFAIVADPDPQEPPNPQLYDTGSVMHCSAFAYGKEAVQPQPTNEEQAKDDAAASQGGDTAAAGAKSRGDGVAAAAARDHDDDVSAAARGDSNAATESRDHDDAVAARDDGVAVAATAAQGDGEAPTHPAATLECGEAAAASEPETAYMPTVTPIVPNEDMGQRYKISATDATRIVQLYASAGANPQVS